MKRQKIVAVSGVKNSGKTTFIEKILPLLHANGLRVAVIKHDGHEFEPDVPGTDTFKCRRAGAYGVAIFSGTRFMAVKQEPVDEKRLISLFPEADLILLEGFKDSLYPKLELVRAGNSDHCVCRESTLLAVVSDLPAAPSGVTRIGFEDYQRAAGLLTDYALDFHPQ